MNRLYTALGVTLLGIGALNAGLAVSTGDGIAAGLATGSFVFGFRSLEQGAAERTFKEFVEEVAA